MLTLGIPVIRHVRMVMRAAPLHGTSSCRSGADRHLEYSGAHQIVRTEQSDPPHKPGETLVAADEVPQPELRPPLSNGLVNGRGDGVVERLVTESLVARLGDATSGEEGLRG
jgi:hypothetical protein